MGEEWQKGNGNIEYKRQREIREIIINGKWEVKRGDMKRKQREMEDEGKGSGGKRKGKEKKRKEKEMGKKK